LPIFPFLAIFLGKLFRQDILLPKKSVRVLISIMTISFLVLSTFTTSAFVLNISKNDTRVEARDWIYANIPAGSVIFYDQYFDCPDILATPGDYLKDDIGISGGIGSSTISFYTEFYNQHHRYTYLSAQYFSKEIGWPSVWEENLIKKYKNSEIAAEALRSRWYSIEELKNQGANYLIISSNSYKRYDGQNPFSLDNPLYYKYEAAKTFYKEVFNSNELKLIKEFKANKELTGPILKIYKFTNL
jgi:hypothetical protein